MSTTSRLRPRPSPRSTQPCSRTVARSCRTCAGREWRSRSPGTRSRLRARSSLNAGVALADLQRVAVRHGIRLPTSLALVGKKLSQADSIARTLDPELDPVDLMGDEMYEVMLSDAERALSSGRMASYAFTQFEPLMRMPRRLSQLVERAENGTLGVGAAPPTFAAWRRSCGRSPTGSAAPSASSSRCCWGSTWSERSCAHPGRCDGGSAWTATNRSGGTCTLLLAGFSSPLTQLRRLSGRRSCYGEEPFASSRATASASPIVTRRSRPSFLPS